MCIEYIVYRMHRVSHAPCIESFTAGVFRLSSLLYRLGRAVVRTRAWVLVAWLALLAVLGGGALVFQQGMQTSLEIPGAESQEALDHLNNVFPQMTGSRAQMVFTVPEGEHVDDPQVREAFEASSTGSRSGTASAR